MIDLHLHTAASDGRRAPGSLVEAAASAGLRLIAVTDHDTVAGVAEAVEAGRRAGVLVVAGIEITAVLEGRDLHVLGYFFDAGSPRLGRWLEARREERADRIRALALRLEALGMPIDAGRLIAEAGSLGASLGRPLVARAMVEAGYAADIGEAFERWIAEGRPAFVAREGPSPAEVVRVVREVGGIASLAHPGLEEVDHLVPALAEAGLSALEAYHADHDAPTTRRYLEMADALGLEVTGGSDYHGCAGMGGGALGSVVLPQPRFDRLRERWDRERRGGA